MQPRKKTISEVARERCPSVIVRDPNRDGAISLAPGDAAEHALICDWKPLSEGRDKFVSFKAKCTGFENWFDFQDFNGVTVRENVLNQIIGSLNLLHDYSKITANVIPESKEYYLIVKISDPMLRLQFGIPEEKPKTFTQKFCCFFNLCCGEKEEAASQAVEMAPYHKMEM